MKITLKTDEKHIVRFYERPIDFMQEITFGELKAQNYTSRSIKDELRENLIIHLRDKDTSLEGILGYDDTVIPELQTAILSRHNILLLGLRGQAKTRIARLLVNFLDEYIPYIAGSEIFDDPFHPISWFAKNELATKGDKTPIAWLHRSERYTEKLATPDVTVADLIGDVDPIKAATLKLNYNDERVIHFGLIPRAHRGIFVINELPDLQARIQVALFNMLQEKDIQIRGFKLRLPLDVQFIFTANPEDYTNRGSIVTPLKDRIESQILTHYPKTIEISRQITFQEARLTPTQKLIEIDGLLKDLIEQVAFEARKSEFIDQKSGVSARLTITAFENLISTAERRMLISGDKNTFVRLSDLAGIIPAITGKIELVYEGELEGPAHVASTLIGKSVKTLFARYFPDAEKAKKNKNVNPFAPVTEWFTDGNTIQVTDNLNQTQYKKELMKVTGLLDLVKKFHPKLSENQTLLLMEFVLHGLAEYSQLSKNYLRGGFGFSDMFDSLFNAGFDEEEASDDFL